MTLDELLNIDSQYTTTTPREEHIQATIRAAQQSYVHAEAEMPMARHTFLRIQLALIHKRWWLAQALILALVWWALPQMDDSLIIARCLGLTASLFVILLIPELAKNRTYQCLEIESTTHYTLRHIYAARMFLTGLVDITILTVFCGAVSHTLSLSFVALLTQFLFPLTVTACLCFAALSNARASSSLAAIGACLFWSGLWALLLFNDRLYAMITTPVWLALFGLSMVFLAFIIIHWIKRSTKLWEVNPHGTLYE